MNWAAAATIAGILTVQLVAAGGTMFHIVREFDAEVARIDALRVALDTVQKQIAAVENNTYDIGVIRYQQEKNIEHLRRLEDAIHPPTP